MLHDPKTVIGSDFDQETGEKIAPQFIARLQLANCIYEKFNKYIVITGNQLLSQLGDQVILNRNILQMKHLHLTKLRIYVDWKIQMILISVSRESNFIFMGKPNSESLELQSFSG